jgi:two-component system, NarL family, response regulator LiaR
MAIRVLLVDDHAVVRKGVREFLEDEPDIEVVGEAGDGQQVVELAVALQPDVVVMDVAMPHLSGVESTKRIRTLAPSVRVLALTAYDDEPYIFGLLDAGVTGYMLKTAGSDEIVRAVRATAAGRAALGPGWRRASSPEPCSRWRRRRR